MFQYRQVLVRLRQGDSERVIARSRLMGRPKAACFRALAMRMGWLDPQAPLPTDGEIAAALGNARRASSTISSAEAHRAIVERWDAEGISGVVIHAALCRERGYTGSYSSIYRLLSSIHSSRPPDATVPLVFAPAEGRQTALRCKIDRIEEDERLDLRQPCVHRNGAATESWVILNFDARWFL
jgi:hypothetical protein